ncbi:hypothetical protein [Yinghuangia seranimata]|uniref:hypothetical protein n=1 Tax=Yinghuangia seranimata TaxID=408067 RepID=UPI00248CC198|nr:hypothetical protein [Yinghuangia seranimata]MDI2131462.1 hypothetical protein [Yinghuangia seranimata]
MTGFPDLLKDAVGGLPDEYAPHEDPYRRIATGARARRRRRVAMATGGVAAVAALAIAVPLSLGDGGGAGEANTAGVPSAANASPDALNVPRIPAGSALPGYERVPGAPVYAIGSGRYKDVDWAAGSVGAGTKGGAPCIVSRNYLLHAVGVCFDQEVGMQQVQWQATEPFVEADGKEHEFGVFGIAPRDAATVRVSLESGAEPVVVPAVRTATSSEISFFTALIPASGRQKVTLQAFNASGAPLGGAVAAEEPHSDRLSDPDYCHSAAGMTERENPPSALRMSDLAELPCGNPWTELGLPASPKPTGKQTRPAAPPSHSGGPTGAARTASPHTSTPR